MRRYLFGLTVALSAGLHVWMGVPARADGGNIQVVQVGAESRYPDDIRFFVTASSPDLIDEIRIFFKKTGRVTAGGYRALQFEASNLVNAESSLQTGGQNYMPPGTEITYFFEIRDEAGAVRQTPDQRVVYTDARFDWQTLSSGPITVYYYGAGAEERARMALKAAREAMDRMAPVLGFDPSEPIRIVSYHTYRDMSAALPFSSQVLEGHVQTEGMAFGDERVVIIRGFDPDVRGIASHEITHLAVAEVTGRANIRIPAWLGEGLAEYGNVEPSAQYEEALRSGILGQRIRPLWALGVFGGIPNDIIAAYGQSRSVVQYLVSNYGESKIAELMEAIQSAFDIDQALERVYGFDQYGLDDEWRESVGLEALPRPETPEPRPTQTQAPTPTASSTPLPPTPTSAPTPTPTSPPTATPVRPTPTPEPTLAASIDEAGGGRSSGGCSGARPGQSGAFGGDLAFIAILAGPMAMLLFRGRRPIALNTLAQSI